MTANHATKHAARRYAMDRGVSYRQALDVIRARNAHSRLVIDELAQRVLIEAIEGCGIGHWARIERWDGIGSALITDIGGDRYELASATLHSVLAELIDREPATTINDVDSFVADDIVQTALFGGVIYRFEARRRTATYHA